MKKLIYGLSALLLVLFVISACNKYGTDLAALNGQLVASKAKVKINEPDSLLLVGANTSDTFTWSVSPSGYDSLVTKNNTGLIVFKKSGSYLVKVIDNGNPSIASITVTDSVYKAPVQYTTVPLTGDQITLVPHYYKSATSDSSSVYFVAQAKNFYCGNGTITVSSSLVNGNYSIGFLNVVQPSVCPLGNGPLAAVIKFNQPQLAIQVGTFPITVTLNGVTYTGNMVSTTTGFTFNWNYTSGVLIKPSQINR